MVERIHCDSVVALGKKLVDELGLDESVDTLGRWMAHYIAEKMEAAESTTGEARDQKMSECRDAILKLWAHRSKLPNGQRPFREFERVFRALKSLELDNPTPRYFAQASMAVEQDEEGDATKRWLEKASATDRAAKALIRYCLANAAQDAVDKSRDWVALAEAIAKDEEVDIRAIRAIVEGTKDFTPENPDDKARARVEELLDKLKAFTVASHELSAHLRAQLNQASS